MEFDWRIFRSLDQYPTSSGRNLTKFGGSVGWTEIKAVFNVERALNRRWDEKPEMLGGIFGDGNLAPCDEQKGGDLLTMNTAIY